MKIPLAVTLIREIDECIVAGLGGYSTRTEFFRDAAEGLLLELKFEHAPSEPVVAQPDSAMPSTAPPVRVRDKAGEPPVGATIESLHETALRLTSPTAGAVVEGIAQVDQDPLFGLHNRDYPSLWVAHRLAARAEDLCRTNRSSTR